MENIKIIKNSESPSSWEVIVGDQTTELLKRQNKLSSKEKETLTFESVDLLSNCCSPHGGECNNTGLAIGYVQSGKTLSFTTVTALAKDNSFKIVIILAGIGNNLLNQTTLRLKEDLLADSDNAGKYKIHENPDRETDDHKAISRSLRLNDKPLIVITVLKHYQRINKLMNVLVSNEVKKYLGQGAVLIIDDEADQASLNTLARRNSKSADWEDEKYSSTYNSLLDLRSVIPNHTYLQYTATPQGPLLISLIDLLSPDFHRILTPGKNYKGGKHFFIDDPYLIKHIPRSETYHHKDNNLGSPPESLLEALRYFFIGCAIQIRLKKKVQTLSMMIHADNPNDANRKFKFWIESIVENWSDVFELPMGDPNKQQIIAKFLKDYKLSRMAKLESIDVNDIITNIREILLDTNIELVIKDKNEIQWSKSSSHILIGANKLNRGFTVEGLMVTYMPRYSKGKSNADTIQQRCRFFGYKDAYIDTCRVYLPSDSIDEYINYVHHEESLREGLKTKTLTEFKRMMVLDDSMNPTRNNILSENLVRTKLMGWRQFNSLYKSDSNKILFENLIASHGVEAKSTQIHFNYTSNTKDRSHLYFEVSMMDALSIVSEYSVTTVSDIMRKQATIQYLSFWKKDKEKKCFIVYMGPQNSLGRKRSLIESNGTYRINNIWSGPSNLGSEDYPGDKGICFPNAITIQIHLVNIKKGNHAFQDKCIYTLGIHYPLDMAIKFVGINS
jgi:hypothetical protein